MSQQQKQTHRFFRRGAAAWQKKSVGAAKSYNIVKGRNNAVLATLDSLRKPKALLDVGCGTGQLVVAVAQRGLRAIGVDFAQEMITACKANARAAGVAPAFICASFFDLPVTDKTYDVISAQGFIEYISPAQMEEFFARSYRMLRPGGSLVVGSRNRLYNVVSLNEFTLMEMKLGVLEWLTREAVDLQGSGSAVKAIAALRRNERKYPQPKRHPATGVRVKLRHQYTPADLIFRLRKHGFRPRGLFPVHFHGLPPAYKDAHPEIHAELAALIGVLAPTDPRLLPYCSTFVLDARRGK